MEAIGPQLLPNGPSLSTELFIKIKIDLCNEYVIFSFVLLYKINAPKKNFYFFT